MAFVKLKRQYNMDGTQPESETSDVIGAMPSKFIRTNAIVLISIFILLLSGSFLFRVPDYAILTGKIDTSYAGNLSFVLKQEEQGKDEIRAGQGISIDLTDPFGNEIDKINGWIAAASYLPRKPGYLSITIKTSGENAGSPRPGLSSGITCKALVSIGKATLFSRVFSHVFRP